VGPLMGALKGATGENSTDKK
jgi:hypothetical protein